MTLRDAAQQALEVVTRFTTIKADDGDDFMVGYPDAMVVRTEVTVADLRAAQEAQSALRAALAETCTWSQDDEGASWDTGCGQLFDLIDGTPSDNGMEYCCYCGKQIDEIDYVKEVADDAD